MFACLLCPLHNEGLGFHTGNVGRHWFKNKITTGEGRGQRQVKTPQNFPAIFKLAFSWFSSFLVAIDLWLFSRTLTKLVLTGLTYFLTLLWGNKSLELPVLLFCWCQLFPPPNFNAFMWIMVLLKENKVCVVVSQLDLNIGDFMFFFEIDHPLKKNWKYSWFTMLCQFLVYSKVIQFYIYIYIYIYTHTHTHAHTVFHVLFHYGLSQDI